jgi:hypothetical protein
MKKARRLGNGGPESSQQIENQQNSLATDFSSPSTAKTTSSHRRKRKRRSRSKKAARTSTSRSLRREVAVYSGQVHLGIVKIAGKATAYDSNGKRIGVFASLQAATDALDKPLTVGGGA